ncbi:methyl-accepting chemotaxis protein [Nitrincola sp. MINF-07-Sa-05]|uniref:methyl-accepting chemotaxis protein n=1 Tax=Nitrincola salilacus TaxID=3400273 RepID=UPI0039181BC3
MTLRQRISVRFNLVTGAVLLILLTIFSAYNYRETESALSEQFNRQIDAVAQRLQQSIPPAIWNFTPSQALLIVESELAAQVVQAIFVFDDVGDLIVGMSRDDAGEITILEANTLSMEPDLAFDLTWGETVVGSAQIYTDSTQIQQALQDSLIRVILQNLLLIAVVMGAVVILLNRLVTGPIHTLSEALSDIAQGDGDLTRRIDIRRKNEIGQLAESFNTFVAKIHDLVKEVIVAVDDMDGAITDTQQAAARTNRGVQTQRDETDQVAVAMQEMASTAESVSRNASEAADGANSADSEGQRARAIVQTAISGIGNLAIEIDQGANVINALEKDVMQISTVLDVIRGIAEQTNLLALNAAIEAARAGEQGRGFAVVADEVRTLASRTQSSTEEIHRMIERLEAGTQQAVSAMQKSCSKGRETVDQANGAEVALDAVAEAVANINRMNMQISTAANEQTIVASDISQRLTRIADISITAEQDTQEVDSLTRGLLERAQQLHGLVSNFRV